MAEGESVGTSTRKAYEDLEAFAERSRRADEQTSLIAGMPQQLERAVLYLVVAVLLVTLAILYFGRVQTVVETRGAIRPQGNPVTLQAGQSGVVTDVSASPGEYLEAGAIVLRMDASRQPGGDLQTDIDQARLKLAELGTALRALESDARGEALTARARHDQALATLLQEYDAAIVKVRELESRIAQAVSRAGSGEGKTGLVAVTMPVSGTITDVTVRGAGAIVTAGAAVATIVPSGGRLMVETTATSKDVGSVRPGVEARIKVDAYPFQQYGTARAQVVKVRPAGGANASFVVQLDLLDQSLTVDGTEHRLFPGLTVQADLVTGRQRLLDVLLRGRAAVPATPK